ncbi:MAG: N-acetylneuraminate synthase [Candidatus Giovannonibacteria bacterium]|nr:MAG: N-acetylneuraminate synthase [Candidatus Giovannonibacteria bacterium]
MNGLIISGYEVNYGNPPFIIAEAGVNHNGDFDLALKLIDAASNAGADAVKFQTFRAEQVVTGAGKMADYQKKNIGAEESQLEMLRKLELKEDWYPALIKRAKEKGIIFLSTPHGGFQSVDLLESYDVPAFKFGSGDLANTPLLEYAARLGKPMLISTGMSNLEDVKEAVDAIKKAGNDQILVFHCTTDYPLSSEDVNLRAMQTLMKELGGLVGYSDHTVGPQAAIAAVALGACMIEKHFTLDRKMKGPDHIASTEPKEFQEMVAMLKQVPLMMGSGVKELLPAERQYVTVARKSIVAACDIKKGEKFTRENLDIRRPGTGMPPKYLNQIIGKTAKSGIPAETLISEEMFSNQG